MTVPDPSAPVLARRRAAGRLVATGLVIGALGACSTMSGGSMTPEEQLRARPAFEQAEREYLDMLQEMRTALSGIAPGLRWRASEPRQSDRAACRAPFTDVTGAEAGTYDSGDAFGAVPDADWPRAVQVVTGIAREHGFANVNKLTDKPGNHVVDLIGDWGQTVQFGSAVNTTLIVLGPCLLHESARQGVRSSGWDPAGTPP